MKTEEIEARARASASQYFQEIAGASVQHTSGPSLSYIRRERRLRGPDVPTETLQRDAPIEHRFVYKKVISVAANITIERVFVVVTDDSGNVKDILESK